jgi:hypothetical protein
VPVPFTPLTDVDTDRACVDDLLADRAERQLDARGEDKRLEPCQGVAG